MFFKVANTFVATLFLGLLILGLRHRSWSFVVMNFAGMVLNIGIVWLDAHDRLTMAMLFCAVPALALVVAADITIVFRDHHEEKPAPAPAAVPPKTTPGCEYLLITSERRFKNELKSLHNIFSHDYARALNHWQQGYAAFVQNRFEAAIAPYEALLLFAATPSALSNLAAILIAAHRPEAALPHCETASSLDPEHHEAWVNRGGALSQLSRNAEALNCFEHAVALQPNALTAWVFRGNLLQKMGKWQEAIDSYHTAQQLNPHRPEIWYEKAVTYLRQDRAAEAFKCLDHLAQSEHAEGLYLRGNLLLNWERHQEAAENFSRLTRLQPRHANAWNNHGVALIKSGRLKEAMTSFEQALQIAPENFQASFNRGLVLERLGRVPLAKSSYQNFLKYAPPELNGRLEAVQTRLRQLDNRVVKTPVDFSASYFEPLAVG